MLSLVYLLLGRFQLTEFSADADRTAAKKKLSKKYDSQMRHIDLFVSHFLPGRKQISDLKTSRSLYNLNILAAVG